MRSRPRLPARPSMLKLLRRTGPMHVNMISAALLKRPQSTIATNIKVLEASALLHTEAAKARKGPQKICSVPFDGVVIRLEGEIAKLRDNLVEVSMADRSLHRLRGERALWALLDGRDHRPVGRS